MFWPREIWGRYAPSLDALKEPANRGAAVQCLNHMASGRSGLVAAAACAVATCLQRAPTAAAGPRTRVTAGHLPQCCWQHVAPIACESLAAPAHPSTGHLQLVTATPGCPSMRRAGHGRATAHAVLPAVHGAAAPPHGLPLLRHPPGAEPAARSRLAGHHSRPQPRSGSMPALTAAPASAPAVACDTSLAPPITSPTACLTATPTAARHRLWPSGRWRCATTTARCSKVRAPHRALPLSAPTRPFLQYRPPSLPRSQAWSRCGAGRRRACSRRATPCPTCTRGLPPSWTCSTPRRAAAGVARLQRLAAQLSHATTPPPTSPPLLGPLGRCLATWRRTTPRCPPRAPQWSRRARCAPSGSKRCAAQGCGARQGGMCAASCAGG